MATGDRVRVGFIGAGQIAALHALAYEDNPSAVLAAVADADPDVAARRAEAWGVPKWCTDYRELLADPHIDAVEIILPHHLHLPVAVAALEAGKHVSLQKPMCLSLDEADRIAAAAAASGKLFRVFENFRSYEPFRFAKSLLEAGEIGEPLSMRIKVLSGKGVGGWIHTPQARAWRLRSEESGGWLAILDHGYHITSIAMYLMGPVEQVHTMIGFSNDVPDASSGPPAMITFKFAGGDRYGSWEIIRAPNLLVKTRYYQADEWVEITGSRGVLWVNRCSGELLDVPPVTLYRDGEMRGYSHLETDWGESFRHGGWEFTDAILAGAQPDLTAAEARGALAFGLAAVRSAQEHRTVNLAELERQG